MNEKQLKNEFKTSSKRVQEPMQYEIKNEWKTNEKRV